MDFLRKNKKVIFISGVVLLAVLLGLFIRSGSKRVKLTPPHPTASSILWETFEGTNPPFNFIFEYPGSWETKEIMFAGKFNMLQVLGPQDKVTKFIPGIYIKIKEFKGRDLPSKFSETLLQREGKFKGFKKIHEGDILIAGMKGSRLCYQYVLPLPMRSMHTQDTVLRREESLVENGGKSYQISLWMTEEQYKIYKQVFDHILETFKFLN